MYLMSQSINYSTVLTNEHDPCLKPGMIETVRSCCIVGSLIGVALHPAIQSLEVL